MTFRIYTIPFFEDGIEVLCVETRKTLDEVLKSSLVDTVTDDEVEFSTFQGRVLFPRSVSRGNYLTVTTDERTTGYWVSRWEDFSNGTTAAYLRYDLWVNGLYPATSYEDVTGYVTQTTRATLNGSFAGPDFPEVVSVADRRRTISFPSEFDNAVYTFSPVGVSPGESLAELDVVTCLSVEGGTTLQLVFPVDAKLPEDGLLNYQSLDLRISYASTVIKYTTDVKDFECSVQKVYVIPHEWVRAHGISSATVDVTCATVGGSQKVSGVAKYFNRLPQLTRGKMVKVDDLFWKESVTYPDPADRIFLRTPQRFIELRGGVGKEGNILASVFLETSYEGHASDDIKIYLCIDGQFLDVSDDFTLDFTVNQQALWQSQHQALFALQGISSVIGGIAGAATSVATHDYAGAVTGALNTATGVGNMITELHRPGSVIHGGSVMNGLFTIQSPIAFVSVSPSNSEEMKNFAQTYGYTIERPIYTYTRLVNDEGFIRAVNVIVKRTADNSGESATYIRRRLEEGIILKKVSS